ncbi:hypothetical protein ACX8Z9_15390 [Arthrobacter halodurans]|uniref:Lipoprotein n=1 Tax=Arthrobacter halodurans TaxID=516699 RepID=A0ABV4URF8_9MICC
MSRRAAVVPMLACAALLASCGTYTDQTGPLVVGPASGEPENTICSAIEPEMLRPGFAETIYNETNHPAEILSIDLAEPRNLEVTGTGAWKLDDGILLHYMWSDAEAARDRDTAKFVANLSPAEGFVLNPGDGAGVAVTAEVLDASQPAGAHQLRVRYRSNGREYAEVTNVSYKLEPDGCDYMMDEP